MMFVARDCHQHDGKIPHSICTILTMKVTSKSKSLSAGKMKRRAQLLHLFFCLVMIPYADAKDDPTSPVPSIDSLGLFYDRNAAVVQRDE